MTAKRVTIGNVEVASVFDGALYVHPSFLFAGIPPDVYEAALGEEQANDHGDLPINRGGFLVQSSGRTILVDTGVGTKHAETRLESQLLTSLDRLGVRPEDIDVVVNTHLHFDHVGWNCSAVNGSFTPTFPNAEYWISREEWDFWTEPSVVAEEGPHLKTDVLPLRDSGQLRLFEGEAVITPELLVLPTPGHTPGHCSIAIDSANERGIILGDVAHHPLHLIRFWVCAIDEVPRISRRTKRMLAEQMIKHRLLVAAGHFTPNSFGRLIMADGHRAWQSL